MNYKYKLKLVGKNKLKRRIYCKNIRNIVLLK